MIADILLSFTLPIVVLGLPAMAEALCQFLFRPVVVRLGTT